MIYGAACLGLAAYSVFLVPAAGPSRENGYEEGAAGVEPSNIVLRFMSTETIREAGGALIMAQAMWLCSRTGKPSQAGSVSVGGAALGFANIAVAAAGIALGIFLPRYLREAGIAVPAHCGGEDL